MAGLIMFDSDHAGFSLLMRNGLFEEDGVTPSAGVAMWDCVVVPVCLSFPLENRLKNQCSVMHQASMGAGDSSLWLGGAGMAFGGALSGIIGVRTVATRMVRRASTRVETLLCGVHEVGIRVLSFLRSGSEDYKEDLT